MYARLFTFKSVTAAAVTYFEQWCSKDEIGKTSFACDLHLRYASHEIEQVDQYYEMILGRTPGEDLTRATVKSLPNLMKLIETTYCNKFIRKVEEASPENVFHAISHDKNKKRFTHEDINNLCDVLGVFILKS